MDIYQELLVALPPVLVNIVDDYEEKRVISEIQHVEWCLHFDIWLLGLKSGYELRCIDSTTYSYIEGMSQYSKFTGRAIDTMMDRYFNKKTPPLQAVISWVPGETGIYLQDFRLLRGQYAHWNADHLFIDAADYDPLLIGEPFPEEYNLNEDRYEDEKKDDLAIDE